MASQWRASADTIPSSLSIALSWREHFSRNVFSIAVPLVMVADGLVVHFVVRLVFALRFEWQLFAPVPVAPPWPPYFVASLVLASLWVGTLAALGMYRDRRGQSHFDDALILSCALAIGALIALTTGFFYRGFSFSRLILVISSLCCWLTLCSWHYCVREAQRSLLRRGWGALNTLIIGCNSLSEMVGTRLYRHPEVGHRLVGFVPGPTDQVDGDRWVFPAWSRRDFSRAGSGAILGSLHDVERIVWNHRIDEVVLAIPGAGFKELFDLMGRCSHGGRPLRFRIVPELAELVTAKLTIGELDGVPTLEIWDVPLRKWHNRFVKRSLDVAMAGTCGLLLSPLAAAIALAIWFDRLGPILFRQERMGRDGRTFHLLKFRTMVPDAEILSGPVWTSKDDPRVTRVGAILRRWSLDELPQLWNVLVGDMSLVGPRPERPYFVDQFRSFIPKYMDRHLVRAGLTGWAQINGLRGEEGSIEERTRYDIYYVENWSPFFDLKILLQTLYEVVVHKGY